MDQPTRPRAAGDPAIRAILQRVETLRGADLVELARSYDAACLAGRDRGDRRRVIELRELETAVSAALRDRLGVEVAEALGEPWAAVA